MGDAAATSFPFSTPLQTTPRPALYWISIPARVSRAIGRRGPVPVVAVINGTIELKASIAPVGGGRHRLQLNARVRDEGRIEPGDRVQVVLRVDADPQAEPTPPDLADALREAGATEAFEGFPPGRRSHIVRWIAEAVADRTRGKRVAKAVEVALQKAEADQDRATGRGGPRSPARRARA